MYWFPDGLYIIKAQNKYANAVAGKVTRIGNMNAGAAYEAIRPLVSYENEPGFKSSAVYYLAIPEFLHVQGIANNSDEISVSYKKNGKEETTVFKSVDEKIMILVLVDLIIHQDGRMRDWQVIIHYGKRGFPLFVIWSTFLQIKLYM